MSPPVYNPYRASSFANAPTTRTFSEALTITSMSSSHGISPWWRYEPISVPPYMKYVTFAVVSARVKTSSVVINASRSPDVSTGWKNDSIGHRPLLSCITTKNRLMSKQRKFSTRKLLMSIQRRKRQSRRHPTPSMLTLCFLFGLSCIGMYVVVADTFDLSRSCTPIWDFRCYFVVF